MQVPQGFSRLTLPASEFVDSIGPFHGRHKDGQVVLALHIEARHANARGIAHGGLLLGYVDVALTAGSNIASGLSRFLTTVSVSCDFIGPARIGDWLFAHVQVLRVTASHVFSSILLDTPSGSVVARASGVLTYRGDPDPAFHSGRYFSETLQGVER